MRPSWPALLVACGALALAGCTAGPPAPGPEPAPTSEDAGEPPVVTTLVPEAPAAPDPYIWTYPYEGRISGAGAPGLGYFAPLGNQETHAYLYAVPAGATAMVVELAWSDFNMDLDLEAVPPDCDVITGGGSCVYVQGGAPMAGDTPVRLLITDPALLNQTGDWGLYVWAKNAVNTPFHGAISIFFGIAPSDDYTALQ